MPRPLVRSDGPGLRVSASEWRALPLPDPSEGWYPTTDEPPAQVCTRSCAVRGGASGIGAVRVAGVVEAFNLLDMQNEVEEDVTTGPSFRVVTATQPPRAVRLGLRLEL